MSSLEILDGALWGVDDPLVTRMNATAGGLGPWPRYFVGGFAASIVRFTPHTSGQRLRLRFYNVDLQPDFSQYLNETWLATDVYRAVAAEQTIEFVVSHRGPWMEVRSEIMVGAGGTYDLQVVPTNRPVDELGWWQRSWPPPLVDDVNVAHTVDVTYGPFPVAAFDALGIQLTRVTAGVGWTLTIDWWGANFLPGSRVYEVNTGKADIVDVIPNQGPFVTITLSASSYAGSPMVSLLVQGMRQTGRVLQSGILGGEAGVSIAAGAARLTWLTPVTTGMCLYVVTCTGTTFDGTVRAFNRAGTSRRVAALVSAGAIYAQCQFIAPSQTLQVEQHNSGAGALTFDWSVIAL